MAAGVGLPKNQKGIKTNEKEIDFMPLAATVIRLSTQIEPDVFQAMVDEGCDPDSPDTLRAALVHSTVYALSLVLTPLLQPLNPSLFDALAAQLAEHSHDQAAPPEKTPLSLDHQATIRAMLERLYRRPNGNENADESQGS